MKDFLIYLLTQITDHPDEISVTESSIGPQVVFSVHTHPQDMGKVIGKEGKIIHAIRNLVKVLAVKEDKLVRVELVETP